MNIPAAIVAKLRERAERYDQLTALLSSQDVAGDGRRSAEILRERGQLEQAAHLHRALEDLRAARGEAERILEESTEDVDVLELARDELAELTAREEQLDAEIKAELVTEEQDHRRKVIVEIRAGTGGDEATLFVADLLRMYTRYCEARRWKLEPLESTGSEVGGLKDVTFAVEGEGAWSRLRFESGGHRVQRVPATESQGRIHTSAATVAVLPEAEEAEITVRDEDLRIDTMRAGGPGGQSVNKTSSAVRITHLPSGTVVQCQDEKSQHKNKAKALRILKSRLLEAERQRLHAERSASRKTQVGTGDRSARVRTYNWPQNRVTDHREGGGNYSLEQIVAGKLDALLEGLMAEEREERIRNL